MSAEHALPATQAARRLGITTKEVLRLMHARELRIIMVKGIAHVPESAIDEYKAKHAA
ncbi:MAG TPA: hypothetical protein VJM33_18740 [Microthrixaceae bacterium]|nr:hypothetical protein [Microthrixaceae bacterium]